MLESKGSVDIMPTKKKGTGTASRKATGAGKKTTGRAKASTAKADDGPGKRELQRQQNEELRTKVVDMRENDASWGDIAEKLKITSGKAQFLHMQHRVATGDVKKIVFKADDDEALTKAVIAAREKQDEFSSWGWISARTGVSEGRIKKLAADAGHEVKGSNVAVARAEKNGSAKKADGKTGTQAGRKGSTTTKKPTSRGNAKVAAAKKRAAKKTGKTS